jgi:hypothetical protein
MSYKSSFINLIFAASQLTTRMGKNYLKQSGIWTMLILGGLLLLHLLPTIRLGSHTLRKVDLLSDVRPDTPPNETDEETDSLLPLPPTPAPTALPDSLHTPRPAFVDTCRTGTTCIIDYADSTRRGMYPFYSAIDRLREHPSTVHVAVFGDSFIEADILTADLRRLLQQAYGGHGVGYVDITSNTNGFRPTVVHNFKGWQSHSITDSSRFNREYAGIAGRYFIPTSGATVELSGNNRYTRQQDTCQVASIFFTTQGGVTLSARINGKEEVVRRFPPARGLQQMSVEGEIGSIRWTVTSADSACFYGTTLDDRSGITIDNFSLRGSSGLSLQSIPMATLREFDRLRPYDLIVLVYGLNVATERGRLYDKYKEGMNRSIEHMKEAFPQAGFLLVSVGDRDYRTEEGELRTMPGIINLIRYQQALAADHHIAFWNLFEAMGGRGSIEKMVESNPPQANLDYTHINFRGGKRVAQWLFDALTYGKEQDERRRAYEAE